MKVLHIIVLAGLGIGISHTNAEVSNLVEHVSGLDHQERISYYDEIISKQEIGLAKFYRVRGNSHYSLGNYAEAELDFRKALIISRGGNIEYVIGKSLLEQVKYHEALEMFQLAKEKCTEESTEHEVFLYEYHIAQCLFDIKKHKEAIEIFDRLKKEYPKEDMSNILQFIEKYKRRVNTK